MSIDEMPWKYHHHRSSFLPPCHMVEEHFALAISFDVTTDPQSPILTRGVDSEGNLCNITKSMPMYISIKPGILQNIYIGQNSSPSEFQSYTNLFKEFQDVFSWTYEEIPGIHHYIVFHGKKPILMPSPSARNYDKFIHKK